MAKLVINNDEIAEEFFEDARLLGIQCPQEPHRMVWLINRRFGYKFRYQAGSEILLTKKARKFSFPVFASDETNFALTHFIYANQHEGEYLLSELKHFDFLWLIKGDHPNNQLISLLQTELKNLESVQLVMELNSDKIVNKKNLVL